MSGGGTAVNKGVGMLPPCKRLELFTTAPCSTLREAGELGVPCKTSKGSAQTDDRGGQGAVKKAVITCGGYATRLLPITKAVPKEMLPVGDKPVIHYILEELAEAGIRQVLILIGRGRETLQNYLDKNYELDDFLNRSGSKTRTNFFENLEISYRRVPLPRGVADCILHAEQFAGRDSFVLCYCDDIFFNGNPTAELLANYRVNKMPAILGCAVPIETARRYGVIMPNDEIIEKPKKPKSNIVAVGRYLLPPKIFGLIKEKDCIVGALNKLQPKQIVITAAARFDTGCRVGYYDAFAFKTK
jgi:UTP--glucose-1-phosphate uridylyltransferase